MQDTFSQCCSMKPDQITRISQMITSHPEFSGIRTTINPNRETYHPSQVQQIPEGEVLVTFEIPRKGIFMPGFYKEFAKALQPPESTATIQRERGR